MVRKCVSFDPAVDSDKPSESKVPSLRMCVVAAAAGIGGSFQFGLNLTLINVPTVAVQEFMNATLRGRGAEAVGEETLLLLWSLVVAAYTAGGLGGALVAGPLATRLGRRGGLLVSNAFALSASLMMGLSRVAASHELIIIGRFVMGVNSGIGMNLQPMYLSESAPRSQRGALAMSTIIFCTFGLIVGQVVGLREVLGRAEHWAVVLSLPCVPALLQLLSLPCCPESPRFLLIDRGDRAAATTALMWLRGVNGKSGRCGGACGASAGGPGGDTEGRGKSTGDRLAPARRSEEPGGPGGDTGGSGGSCGGSCVGCGELARRPETPGGDTDGRGRSTGDRAGPARGSEGPPGDAGGARVGCGGGCAWAASVQRELEDMEEELLSQRDQAPTSVLQLLRDVTVRRQLVIIVAVNVMQQFSGINAIYFYASYLFKEAGIPADEIRYVTVGTGMAEMHSTILCGILIEWLGRRPLLMFGFGSMGLCCLLISVSMILQTTFRWMSYLSVAMTFAFIVSLGMGPAGIVGLLPAELFTQRCRPAAYMISGSVYWASFFVIGLLFPFLMKALGPYCYLIFFADCMAASMVVYFLLPETKNRSFLEITRHFQELRLAKDQGKGPRSTGVQSGARTGPQTGAQTGLHAEACTRPQAEVNVDFYEEADRKACTDARIDSHGRPHTRAFAEHYRGPQIGAQTAAHTEHTEACTRRRAEVNVDFYTEADRKACTDARLDSHGRPHTQAFADGYPGPKTGAQTGFHPEACTRPHAEVNVDFYTEAYGRPTKVQADDGSDPMRKRIFMLTQL